MKLTLMVCGLLLTIAGTSAADNAIRGYVIGNGGASGSPGGDGTLVLRGTVGQALVGTSNNASLQVCHGFWCFGGSRIVQAPEAEVPAVLSFGMPAPNPGRSGARFALGLPRAADVTLSVYDIAGRMVGAPLKQHFGAGRQEIDWRAPDERPGVYFARLTIDGVDKGTRRIVLLGK